MAHPFCAVPAPRYPLMRNQPNHTSSNQQHYDHTSEGNGGQIHKVLIGFAPALWVLRHLNCQYNGNPPSRNLASLIKRRHAARSKISIASPARSPGAKHVRRRSNSLKRPHVVTAVKYLGLET